MTGFPDAWWSMRSRIFLLWIVLCSGVILWAAEAPAAGGDQQAPAAEEGKKAELYADSFHSEGDTVYATGNVVLSYDGTLFLAKKARYDRRRNVIVVEGNVEILSRRGSKVYADKVVFEVDSNHVTFQDFYHTDREDIWVYADTAEKQDGNYTMRNSILSSCRPDNPDWTVRFREAHYDSGRKYMKLKGVKIYAKSVPVFYTPYLGFSLERERHSGLLMPHLGLKKDEGFIYDQPYFWAISPSMDLQLDPQIRSKRGGGLYGTFRFVDGPHSGGKIRLGYFYDKNTFVRENNLKNADHYGAEILYESDRLLGSWLPEGYREGLYANIDLFNDIDYHNLQYEDLSHLEETSRYKESRVNYFLYNDRNYFGMRARYFIDTQSLENNETIQELPSMQYHRYYTPLIDDWIDYSVDARFYNYHREEGPEAQRGIVSVPLLFHRALFDDYLNLAVEEEFAASDTHFNDKTLWSDRAQALENHYAAVTLHHSIELSSNLIRSYTSGLHTMLLKAAFTKTTILAEGDLTFDEISDAMKRDFDLDQVYDARWAFSMHHFWKSTDGGFGIDYLVLADYYPDSDTRWNQLRQELHLHYGAFGLDTRFDYSLQTHQLSQWTNSLHYSTENFGISLDHTRREDPEDPTLTENELGIKTRYKQSDLLSWYGAYSYDFKKSSTKDWQAGMTIDRKCWNFTILFEQEITPVLKKNGGGSIRNNAIYFRFNLVPFGGVGSGARTAI